MCFTSEEIVAYLCLNMINFDVDDLSERRSEEVITFFFFDAQCIYNFVYVSFHVIDLGCKITKYKELIKINCVK